MTTLPAAVSFDLDGTLYSTRRAGLRLLLAMPHRLPFLADYQRARRALREQIYPDGAALRRAELALLARRRACDEAQIERQLALVIETELIEVLRRTGPDAVARPLLQGLIERGVPVAVLSDLPVERKLAALGLADLPLRCRLDAGETGALKPHPRSFERVASALGVALGDLVHVGDRHDTDVCGAERCGATAVWLTRRPNRPLTGRTFAVPTLAELAARWGIEV
ncbi:MAG: HAD family hydrolase [Deltaproteobacteria bacterium]|nr:HAD family hydrolase [Deltaproteobacteria bacterium]